MLCLLPGPLSSILMSTFPVHCTSFFSKTSPNKDCEVSWTVKRLTQLRWDELCFALIIITKTFDWTLKIPLNLPTYQPTYLPTYLPNYLPTYLHKHLPTYPPTHLPTYPRFALRFVLYEKPQCTCKKFRLVRKDPFSALPRIVSFTIIHHRLIFCLPRERRAGAV